MAGHSILRTRICDELGIEYPIFSAGMGITSGPTLVAAVSNAGGMGILGAAGLTPKQTRDWILKTKGLTDRPFGVDLILPAEISNVELPTDLRQLIPTEHFEFVRSMIKELGLPEVTVPEFQAEVSMEISRQVVEICLEERIAVFVSGLGNPAWVVPLAHEVGMKVMGCVGNTRNARRLKDSGVDVIIAQGYEGGGHTGRVGSLSLIPQVVDAVSPTPVLAAGGIVDGRGLAAGLVLGAEGGWLGTAFVATYEANKDAMEEGLLYYNAFWDKTWKQKIVEAIDEDTTVSKIVSGKTARYLKNKLIDAWTEKGFSFLPMPLQTMLIWDLLYTISRSDKGEYVCAFGGQSAGLIKEIRSAKEVVESVVNEAAEILTQGLPKRVMLRR
jgi:nitronate monooxygenase